MWHKKCVVMIFVMGLSSFCLANGDNGVNIKILREQAEAYFKPIPQQVNQVRGNVINPKQVELGHQLFFEPRLSSSHLISCNTCHNVGTGGADNLPTSVGHGWKRGTRNAPTVFNAVFNIAQFWDGRAKDLAEQATGPIQNSLEMYSSADLVGKTLNSIPEYVKAFKEAFPNDKQPVSLQNIANALESYETTLLTPDARFDQWLKGDENALSTQEKKGLQTFITTGCVSCHHGVNIGGEAYYPFGVLQAPNNSIRPESDKGRFAVTHSESDEYVFRAASLRNVALTAPYFHSGQIWDLHEAVKIMGEIQLGNDLNDQQVDDIVAFLKTLTGEQPKVVYPILPPSTNNTPKPQLEQQK